MCVPSLFSVFLRPQNECQNFSESESPVSEDNAFSQKGTSNPLPGPILDSSSYCHSSILWPLRHLTPPFTTHNQTELWPRNSDPGAKILAIQDRYRKCTRSRCHVTPVSLFFFFSCSPAVNIIQNIWKCLNKLEMHVNAHTHKHKRTQTPTQMLTRICCLHIRTKTLSKCHYFYSPAFIKRLQELIRRSTLTHNFLI